MLRIIKEFQPTWVIGENVIGIASMVLTNNGIEMDDNAAEAQTGNRTNVLVRCITDLEAVGYDVQTFCIPACSIGAPHRRDRIWIVARRQLCNVADPVNERHVGRGSQCHTDGQGIQEGEQAGREPRGATARCNEVDVPDPQSVGLQGGVETDRGEGQECDDEQLHGCGGEWSEPWIEVATKFCTLDDGLPNGLPRPRGWRNAALKAVGNAIVPKIAMHIMKSILEVERRAE